MLAAVDGLSPLVSVVVLTYNGLHLTQACLESLVSLTQYPSWELIVVDNGSTDGTVEYLGEFAGETPNARLVENGENLGFAEGNNRGICTAKGEIIVLLNNDTVVTRGWLRDLIRHFRDPDTAMVGPITDNAGNEARVIVSAPNRNRWARAVESYCGSHRTESTAVQTLAFFCVAIRASIIHEVGLLDPAYGIGMFEDDDYCRRVSELGYSIRLAEDVFVHHEMSASFDKLGARKQQLFDDNKATYEARWGPWTPHSYREPIVRIDG
jgi:GT2 family glycosyltransferase